MKKDYIRDAAKQAFIDCDTLKLSKILSWTARAESTDEERQQVIKGLHDGENEKPEHSQALGQWIVNAIFQKWTYKNIVQSGLQDILQNNFDIK